MNPLLALAALLSAAIWAIHTFLGGPTVARPLLAATDLRDTPKYTQYYCWHLVTLTLAALSLCFAWSAQAGASPDLGLLAALLCVAFGVWGLVLPARVGQSYGQMPQGWLLLPVGVIGLAGIAVGP